MNCSHTPPRASRDRSRGVLLGETDHAAIYSQRAHTHTCYIIDRGTISCGTFSNRDRNLPLSLRGIARVKSAISFFPFFQHDNDTRGSLRIFTANESDTDLHANCATDTPLNVESYQRESGGHYLITRRLIACARAYLRVECKARRYVVRARKFPVKSHTVLCRKHRERERGLRGL